MRILLENVRLSYPNLFTPTRGPKGDQKPSFGANFIFPPDHPAVAKLRAAFPAVAAAKWGNRADAILKQLLATDRVCLHNGAGKATQPGYDGNLFVSSRAQIRPSVLDKDRTPVDEASGKVYSGCYVNAVIELWCQDSPAYGKRINAQLAGVQFFADGDAFAAGTAASADEFPDLGDQGEVDPAA